MLNFWWYKSLYAILVLRTGQLSWVVHRRNYSADKNRNESSSIQTAVKMKLIFNQLVAYYLDGQDIVFMFIIGIVGEGRQTV